MAKSAMMPFLLLATTASAPAPTASSTPFNGSQPTQRRCHPSPPPALPPLPPPHDPGSELELVIEPIDDIEAKLAERKRRRNEILAKYSSHQGTPQPQTPSVPTESPSTKASTPVGDGHGDATAAEDFGPKPNLRNLAQTVLVLLATMNLLTVARMLSAVCFIVQRMLWRVTRTSSKKSKEVVDDEDVKDMFACDDDEKPKKKFVKKVNKSRLANVLSDGGVGLGAADGPEGYYTTTLGESLGSKYHVCQDGTLLPDAAPKREVAIKIMRSQETMYKSGQREAATLAKLNSAGPDDKRHVVRLERTFQWHGHGSELIHRRIYHLHDIEPDNIIISSNKTALKLCDLGSAADASSAESTPILYLDSRFYRAPETILGLPHDSSLDTWLIKKAKFGAEHFDELGAFLC
ncbi:kinase-like domain-containing protein [Flagelloscypha sp. PMI_526]|nr:kinase-like domain-containing protein [Flagelloscypha sp. PMI_526]